MRSRNFRAWNEIVERGAVTKNQKGKKSQWMLSVESKNCDYETLSPCTGELKQEQWSRIERVKTWSPRDEFLERIFRFWRCSTRELHLHWIRSNIILHFRKKVRLEEQKAQKEERFPSRKTDRLHDLRLLSHVTVPDYADLFSINFRHEDVEDFESRWDETLLSMTQRPGKHVQIQNTWDWSTRIRKRIAPHRMPPEDVDA